MYHIDLVISARYRHLSINEYEPGNDIFVIDLSLKREGGFDKYSYTDEVRVKREFSSLRSVRDFLMDPAFERALRVVLLWQVGRYRDDMRWIARMLIDLRDKTVELENEAERGRCQRKMLITNLVKGE